MKWNIKSLILCFLTAVIAVPATAQSPVKSIRQGNKLYKAEDFAGAESRYGEALEADPSAEKGLFNQGNAYYQQEKYEEAAQNFEITANMFETDDQRARAFHNLGNTHFKAGDLEQSIEAYKNALRLNPSDEDTRYNLALAQKMLRDQQQQQQNQNQQDQQDQNDQNQDQQDEQDQQNQDQDEDGDKDQQQQDQQQDGDEQQQDQQQNQQDQQDGDQQEQQNQGEEGEQQDQRPAPQPAQLSKEEVRRLLEAMANDEQKVQEKIIQQQTKGKKVKTDKDW